MKARWSCETCEKFDPACKVCALEHAYACGFVAGLAYPRACKVCAQTRREKEHQKACYEHNADRE